MANSVLILLKSRHDTGQPSDVIEWSSLQIISKASEDKLIKICNKNELKGSKRKHCENLRFSKSKINTSPRLVPTAMLALETAKALAWPPKRSLHVFN